MSEIVARFRGNRHTDQQVVQQQQAPLFGFGNHAILVELLHYRKKFHEAVETVMSTVDDTILMLQKQKSSIECTV